MNSHTGLTSTYLFKRVIVLRADYDEATKQVVYDAVSEDFDALPDGAVQPSYRFVVTVDYNVRSYRAEKVPHHYVPWTDEDGGQRVPGRIADALFGNA